MAEIIYQYPSQTASDSESNNIRWLTADDFDIFNKHLVACGQNPISVATWSNIQEEGTIYCGFFSENVMVARACVEKYSDTKWEVADVRTVKDYRSHGFAFAVCHFVLQYILSHSKIATIRTEEDNFAMQKVIAKLGFTSTL